MLILKFLALVFALLVLVKIGMLVVAREYWLGLVDKAVASGNRGVAIYGGLAALVGLLILTQVNVIVVGAVMLWTGLLMGLAMLPYKEIMLKWRDELAQNGIERIWWALAIWVGLAVWILWAVFWG
jgi:hypothetical protein